MSDFLKELKQWSTGELIVSASASNPLAVSATFYDHMPDTPVSCLAFFNSSGFSKKTFPLEKQIIRILSRGANRDAAKDLADQAYNLLHLGAGSVLNGVTLDEFYIYNSIARSRPQQVGVDENNNSLFAFELEAIIQEIK